MDRAGIAELTRRFVLVVAQNHRLFALPAMIEGYLSELARRRGEITAEVHSARSLSNAQQAALLEALRGARSEEHTSELKSLMRTSYAVLCLKKKNISPC